MTILTYLTNLQPKPQKVFDKNFNVDVETYSQTALFAILTKLSKEAPPGARELSAEVRYQACNDKLCLPPVRRSVTASVVIDPQAAESRVALPPDYTASVPATSGSPVAASPAPPARTQVKNEGLFSFLLIAFGFGLAAIFTPCVFPMIPITMSFFLNRTLAARREGVVQAGIFCLGIVVLFSLLGLTATAALGPFGVVQLGSSPWVNGFIALIFGLFAVSLLGAFEMALPSGLLTRLDGYSRRGGLLGTLVMGLTFSLASFACVGPLVGTLLAASVEGAGWRPALGMVAFSTGMAAPFFLLALFPSFLRRLPKSGGWLMRVKVVLAFVILAAMLKYLSNVDQVLQWNLLNRERFLASWVVLFALPGLYLLGLVRLEGIRPEEPVGVWRLLLGSLFVAFALSLLPGMFGARLGELDAYVPAPRAALVGEPGSGGLDWRKNQYAEALAAARSQGKRVLVSFTGYACTNCHWMKANMLSRSEIQTALKDFVLLELYTDGTDAASVANQKIEESKFSTVAIPLYAVLDADERVVASFPGLTRKPAEFLAFLKSGSRP